ncbi:MAG: UDP-2,3-diacylglucosamine diphosphatase LpxI [Rickettsiales bacterium]|jgi:DUF1009 family protein|nr:UDP-2,3-diacylglucosamine diphosphatase LpxI [Rickettsiales bacterium]
MKKITSKKSIKLIDMTNKQAQLNCGKIGVIAGGGNFPLLLVRDMIKNKTPFAVMGIEGFVNPEIKKLAGAHYKTGFFTDFGKCINFFKNEHVDSIVIIGSVNRSAVRLNNWRVIKAFIKVLFYKKRHDGIFRIIISEFENNKLKVIGLQDAMPSVMTRVGLLTKTKPSSQDLKDIKIAIIESKKLGERDLGQAVVVMKEKLLGDESIPGTDALISRCLKEKNGIQGGVMAKLPKPGQEMRCDIPAIGFGTIRSLIDGKLNGIVIESEYKTIIEEKEKLIKFADENKIFIMAI